MGALNTGRSSRRLSGSGFVFHSKYSLIGQSGLRSSDPSHVRTSNIIIHWHPCFLLLKVDWTRAPVHTTLRPLKPPLRTNHPVYCLRIILPFAWMKEDWVPMSMKEGMEAWLGSSNVPYPVIANLRSTRDGPVLIIYRRVYQYDACETSKP